MESKWWQATTATVIKKTTTRTTNTTTGTPAPPRKSAGPLGPGACEVCHETSNIRYPESSPLTHGRTTPCLLLSPFLQVARLLAKLTSHKNALSKHIVPALAHYMFVASAVDQDDAVRSALLPGIFGLVEMCSKHELQQLHLLLDSAGQEVLKTTRTSFELMHRYTGKV